MKCLFFAAGWGLLLLSACVHFEPQPLSAERAAADFSDRTLRDAGLKAFLEEHDAARGSWDVNRLALAAVYFHPDVALARAEAAEAAAAVKTAQQRPNPVLGYGSQLASSHVNPITPWFFAPSLSIPIETAGKRARRTEQALAAADAARWRVSERAWQARSRVRGAMLEVFGARQNLRLLEREQELHQAAIEKLTAQMQAGDASPFELTQARLSLNRNRLALADAKRAAAAGEARLAAAVGISPTALRAVSLDGSEFDHLPRVAGRAARDHALTSRADLLALLSDYAAAESALRLEIARQYPDLKMNPGYDYNQGQSRWQLGFNVELPLNRNRGPIAQAEARRLSAEKRFLAQQAVVRGQLDLAVAEYEAARSKADTAAQLAREAETAEGQTRRMVDAGEVSALELTRRQIETSAANVAWLAAKLEAQTTAGALEDAMQNPLP